MRRKDILNKYNIDIKCFRALVRHGHITQIAFGEYEDNPEFFRTFNKEQYFLDHKEQCRANIALGLKNMSEDAKIARLNKLSKSQKISQNRQSTIDKKRSSLQRYWNNDALRKEQSIKASNGWSKKTDEELKEWSSQCSKRSILAYQNMSESAKIQHSINVGKAQKLKNQKLRDSGYYETDEWLQKSQSIQQKINATKRKNHTFNVSRSENDSYELLLKYFDESDIIRQYHSKEYPFNCDFYIVSLKLYIECHYGQYHQPKMGPFDNTNIEHIKQLQKLKKKFEITPKNSRGDNQYGKIIYTWTDLDVRKRKCVEKNALNSKVFYTMKDFKSWLTRT